MEQLFSNLPALIAHAGQNKILYHLVVIIFAAFAAFIPRYFPVLFFSTRHIPEWFNEWMKYVPVSLFTALIVKNVFVTTAGIHGPGCEEYLHYHSGLPFRAVWSC